MGFAAAAAAGLYIETALSLGVGSSGTKNRDPMPPRIYKRTGGNESVPQVMVESSQGKGYIELELNHIEIHCPGSFFKSGMESPWYFHKL